MSNDNNNQNHSIPFQVALEGTKDSHALIATELRKMAEGEGEYRRFFYTSKWVKNIWRAAADVIEEKHKTRE